MIHFHKNLQFLIQKIVQKGTIFLILLFGFLSIFSASAEGIIFKINVVSASQCFNGIDDDGD
jgi:hypothetical protein